MFPYSSLRVDESIFKNLSPYSVYPLLAVFPKATIRSAAEKESGIFIFHHNELPIGVFSWISGCTLLGKAVVVVLLILFIVVNDCMQL